MDQKRLNALETIESTISEAKAISLILNLDRFPFYSVRLLNAVETVIRALEVLQLSLRNTNNVKAYVQAYSVGKEDGEVPLGNIVARIQDYCKLLQHSISQSLLPKVMLYFQHALQLEISRLLKAQATLSAYV
jgi:hypothetical protein